MPNFGSHVTGTSFSSNVNVINNSADDPTFSITWSPQSEGDIVFEANTHLFNRVTVDIVDADLPQGTAVRFLSVPESNGYCATYFTSSSYTILYTGPVRWCPVGTPVLYEISRMGDRIIISGTAMGESDTGQATSIAADFGALLRTSGPVAPGTVLNTAPFQGGAAAFGHWLAPSSTGGCVLGRDDGTVWSQFDPDDGVDTLTGDALVIKPHVVPEVYVVPTNVNNRIFRGDRHDLLGTAAWSSTETDHGSFFLSAEFYPLHTQYLTARNVAADTVFDIYSGENIITASHSTITGINISTGQARIAVNNARTQAICGFRGEAGGIYAYDLSAGSGNSWVNPNPVGARLIQDATYNRQRDEFLVTSIPTGATDYTSCYRAGDPGSFFGGAGGSSWSTASWGSNFRAAHSIALVVAVGPYYFALDGHNVGSDFVSGSQLAASTNGLLWKSSPGAELVALNNVSILPGAGQALAINNGPAPPRVYLTGSLGPSFNGSGFDRI